MSKLSFVNKIVLGFSLDQKLQKDNKNSICSNLKHSWAFIVIIFLDNFFPYLGFQNELKFDLIWIWNEWDIAIYIWHNAHLVQHFGPKTRICQPKKWKHMFCKKNFRSMFSPLNCVFLRFRVAAIELQLQNTTMC